MRLILASASPRRRELLSALGVSFRAITPEVEELTGGEPRDVVLENARRKARAGLRKAREAGGSGPTAGSGGAPGAGGASGVAVLGVDTDVALDGRLLGKAATQEQARERLQLLSGRTHEVLSGVAILRGASVPQGETDAPRAAEPDSIPRAQGASVPQDGTRAPRGREVTAVATSHVTFRELDRATVDLYLRAGEWRDRAGAYAIQGLGSVLVESVHGDFSNVVGLPVRTLLELAPELFSLHAATERGKP